MTGIRIFQPVTPLSGIRVRRLPGRSVEAEHGEECCVDLPLLVDGDPADLIAETIHVDGPDLLDEDSSAFTTDVELGSERRRPSAGRSRGDEHDRARQHRVGLHHYTKSSPALLMADAFGQTKVVDVASLHSRRSGSEPFHQLGNGAHLGPVGFISLQGSHLGSERSAVAEACGGGDQRVADRGRAAEPGGLELGEGA
jgi:hypothetical protein